MKFTNRLFSPTLFWDVDSRTLNLKKHRRFIIERVLKFGDLKDWRAIKRLYSLSAIEKAARETRDLDDKSRNFWQRILKIK